MLQIWSDSLNRLGFISSRSTDTEQLEKYQFTSVTFPKTLNSDSELQRKSDTNLNDKDNDESNSNNVDQLSATVENVAVKATKITVKSNKIVRFADDCGKELITVRMMTEPSDYPPNISASVIHQLLGETDENQNSHQPSASWIIPFKQPASEYTKFRETLDKKFVALENVALKNEICHMVGTIKVKNITFEKKVFVRYTSDGWRSFLDHMATYQPSSSSYYDTFTFDIELPTNDSDPNARIEFCICFETGGCLQGETQQRQYWDSNNGRNYVLTSQKVPDPLLSSPESLLLFGKLDSSEAYACEIDDWTNFAAWRSLPTESPYW